jgi:hypothetical protein
MTSRRFKNTTALAGFCLLGLMLSSPLAGAAGGNESSELPRSRPVTDEGKTRVEVAIRILDLMEVNDAEQSFLADVAVVTQWRDPRLAERWDSLQILETSTVWTPRLQVVNKRELERSLGEAVDVMPDGTVTHRERLTGYFRSLLDLRDFPLDTQSFRIQIVAPGVDTSELQLVLSDEDTSTDFELLSISDWSLTSAHVEPMAYPGGQGGKTLPGLALVFDAEREFSYYLVQVLLPLIAIIMMSWTVFWVDPTVIPARMSVVVTAMLTVIAYRFALGSMVPKLPYLTRLDWFLLGATFLVLLALVAVAATSYYVSKDRSQTVARVNRWSRFVFPSAFVTLVVVLWLV